MGGMLMYCYAGCRNDDHIHSMVAVASPMKFYGDDIINSMMPVAMRSPRWWKLLRVRRLAQLAAPMAGAFKGMTFYADNPEGFEDEVAANEILCIVRGALGRLNESQCHVLELRFVRDLSYREIGDALGITSNNAGVRINRALARLKAALPHLVDSADCLALSAPEARV